MARAISTDNVVSIMAALRESDASDVIGLSIAQIAAETGIPSNTVRRLIARPDLGFKQARHTTNTGALTYYHDTTAMNIAVADEPIKVLEFDDEDKIRFLVHSLMQSLAILDPANKYAQMVAAEQAKQEARQNTKGTRRNFFYWMFTKTLGEEAVEYLDQLAKDDPRWQAKNILKHYDDKAKLGGIETDHLDGMHNMLALLVNEKPDTVYSVIWHGLAEVYWGIKILMAINEKEKSA